MRLRIRSGGQSGADRGALLAALDLGVEYAGWVPKGGKCEDTPYLLDVFPNLWETESSDYRERTELNVRDSMITIIVTPDGELSSPGSKLTVRMCEKYGRPYRVVVPEDLAQAVSDVVDAWQRQPLVDLNIAGTRESKAPGLQQKVRLAVIRGVEEVRAFGGRHIREV